LSTANAECPVRVVGQVVAAEPDESFDATIVVECADHRRGEPR
jgi:hypothetical protein